MTDMPDSRGQRLKYSRQLLTMLLSMTVLMSAGAAQGQVPSVMLEELTTIELRDAIAAGMTTVILPAGGTEQNGPHLALGKHRYVLEYTTERIATELGNALVAPIISYVPQGDIDPATGHMRYPGTITLPNDSYMTLLEYAARSFRLHGFTDIVFLSDSGGNMQGMEAVAQSLNREWAQESVSIHFADEYYSDNGYQEWLLAQGETEATIGFHAGLDTTAELLVAAPEHVRQDQLVPASEMEMDDFNFSGDPTRATVDYGMQGLQLKIDTAVRQIRGMITQ